MRLYVRLRAVLAATETVCIGYRSPVDVPVKKIALDGVYMSHPLTSTVPKRKLSVCFRPLPFPSHSPAVARPPHRTYPTPVATVRRLGAGSGAAPCITRCAA